MPMECLDEGDENITFITPKLKIAKLNKIVNPMDPNEVPNAGALVDSVKVSGISTPTGACPRYPGHLQRLLNLRKPFIRL